MHSSVYRVFWPSGGVVDCIFIRSSTTRFMQGIMPNTLQTDPTPGRRKSKMSILSRNVDKKLLETEFLIAICRHTIKNTVSIDF